MKGKIYIPEQPHEIVSEIWEIIADADEPILSHFIPPVAVPEMVFFIDNCYQVKNINVAAGFIKGQYTTSQRIDFHPHYHLFGIRLHPYGLKQVFDMDASQLTDRIIDAAEHPLTAGITNLIKENPVVDLALIQQLLLLLESQPLHPVSWETISFLKLLQGNSKGRITDIIKNTGIGIRTLQRNFTREVGLTPKKYLRIIRMNDIERQLQEHPNWFTLITHFELTDQSHLIKEFKSFRQHTPADLLKKRLTITDQLPDPERFDI